MRASMHTSCAMMSSSVTPPTDDEGAEVDGAVEARGVAVCVWDHLGLSYALLRRTVAASIWHPSRKNKKRRERGHKNNEVSA